MSTHSYFATAPKGITGLLADELRALEAEGVRETTGGVHFTGPLEIAYRICLWSRTANRVLLPLAAFPVTDGNTLYDGVHQIPWEDHLIPDGTLAVDVSGTTPGLTHTHYAAQRVKDGVVDRFRERFGRRPSVDTERPQLRLNLHLHAGNASLALDLSGESLHRRGYRRESGAAPLKENLAAALLLRAGWSAIANGGGGLVDPLCGTGTLPIEAALMAADCAPGALRSYWGFLGWLGHIPALWTRLTQEAVARREVGVSRLPTIVGYDADGGSVRQALEGVERAGLRGHVHIERRELAHCRATGSEVGLVIANPPYGERLGELAELEGLYAHLGEVLREGFPNWEAAVFTGNPPLGKHLGLRAWKLHGLFNGPIPCQLLRFHITPDWYRSQSAIPSPLPKAALSPTVTAPSSAGGAMLANRLKKNRKELGRWAEREGISCYRLYDADLPEYALAIDLYQGEQRLWVHCQEYEAPATIDSTKAANRLQEALAVIPEVLQIPPDQVFLKVRRRQKDRSQYQKQATEGRFYEVKEGPCTFLVNFTDYLDTGLFLDHRPTRALIRQLAPGRRVLNLYAYTGTATVHAAAGGAAATTSVDLSPTYLAWARRNLARNGYASNRHELVEGEVGAWLTAAVAARPRRRYGLIFLDPPTFSRSKRMEGVLDVQRDHLTLIRQAATLLEPDGTLLFSNNYRRFQLETAALEASGLRVEDISSATLPKDFARNPRIHRCWRISLSTAPAQALEQRKSAPYTPRPQR